MRVLAIFLTIFLSHLLVAQQLQVSQGSVFKITGGKIKLINATDLDVSGTFIGSGGEIIMGGNDLQKIQGGSTGSYVFPNLVINNLGLGVQLHKDITVNDSIFMVLGDLDLINYHVTLGSNGGVSGESSTSIIKATDGSGSYTAGYGSGTGSINTTTLINTGGSTSVAGLGVGINPQTNFGATLVRRGHSSEPGSGDSSIYRYVLIEPTNSSDLRATISIKYDPSELNNNSSGGLIVYQLISTGAKGANDQWVELPSNDNPPFITTTTVDSDLDYIKLTMSNQNAALPVSLIDFSAECDQNAVLLKWATASERNNQHFILEHSFDGEVYQTIAWIDGNGSTSQMHNYNYVDVSSGQQVAYYRLSQQDFDGKLKELSTKFVSCNNQDLNFTVVNPLSQYLQVFSDYPIEQPFALRLFDEHGKIVYTNRLHLGSSWNFSLPVLASGKYLLQLQNQDKSYSIQLVKP
jgi:hypothetical protein